MAVQLLKIGERSNGRWYGSCELIVVQVAANWIVDCNDTHKWATDDDGSNRATVVVQVLEIDK